MVSPVPDFAIISDSIELNYLIEINNDKAYNLTYLRDDKTCVMRDCNDDGSLYNLKNKQDGQKPWLILVVKSFCDKGRKFDVPVCMKCCPLLESLNKEQSYENVKSKLCLHSRVCANIVRNFENPSSLDNWLSLAEDMIDNEKLEIIHKKVDKSQNSQHLCITFDNSKIGILWTQGKMWIPACSLCW